MSGKSTMEVEFNADDNQLMLVLAALTFALKTQGELVFKAEDIEDEIDDLRLKIDLETGTISASLGGGD